MPDLTLAYNFCIQICNDPKARYSQTYREFATIPGTDTYGCDCSSLISKCLYEGGFFENNPWFTTRSMESYLLQAGFKKTDASVPWLAGDILWRSGHTEMVYQPTEGGGITMGAHSSSYPPEQQVSINANPTAASSWTYLYRYGSGGAGSTNIFVIAAICGNFWQESTLNPGLWEGRDAGTWTDLLKGFGLGQWTNTGGDIHGRLYQLSQYLEQNGFAYDSGEGQLNYLVYENTWYSTGWAADFSSLSEFLSSDSTDIAYLTRAFMQGWEGITDGTDPIRIETAQQCYEYILEHSTDTSINTWYVSNNYLTTEQRLNNAVMIYRWMNGGVNPPTPIPSEKHGLKIWMYPNVLRRFIR